MRKSGSAPSVSLTGDGGVPQILNYSQIAEWNRCRYRYNLSTLRRVNSRAFIRALDMGAALHAGMEAGVKRWVKQETRRPGHDFASTWRLVNRAIHDAIQAWSVEQINLRGGRNQLTEEEVLGLEQILECGPVIVKRALEYLNLQRWRVLKVGTKQQPAIELGIRIPFTGWKGFHGTLDLVVHDEEEGGDFIFDYKFRESFTPSEAEEVNLQMAIYQWLLLKRYKIETAGTVMFQGKSRAPAQPQLNKSGTMSRVRIATNWETYRAALLSAGLRPQDYEEEMKPKLDYEFFRLDRMHRSMEEVEAIWYDIVVPAGLVILKDRERERRMFRNMSHMNCNNCWARDFCLTELRDEDTDFLLKTRYIDLNNPQERLVLAPEDLIIED